MILVDKHNKNGGPNSETSGTTDHVVIKNNFDCQEEMAEMELPTSHSFSLYTKSALQNMINFNLYSWILSTKMPP